MIELINVSKEYKKSRIRVLSNTMFNVEEGRFYAVMGSSGSGKTTLLVGIVYQNYNLIECLTLRENILLPLHNRDINPSEFKAVSDEVAEKLGIRDILDHYPQEVSGGEQQRAAICRAIINGPKVILADEPTGNLDSKSTTAVMECFEKLNKEDGITILMVTHDLYTASYCDKVMLFKDGIITGSIDRNGVSRKEFYRHILAGLELGEIYE